MADTTSLVSKSSWFKIGFLVLLVLGALVYLAFQPKVTVDSVYSAKGHAVDLSLVDGITKADKKPISPEKNKAVIVPHHLVASEAIAQGVRSLVLQQPKLVLVVSPDHFGKCPLLACTATGRYTTFFGDVLISTKEVSLLPFLKQPDLFAGEHGISVIAPFIKHYLPDAEIVPIVISQRGRGSEDSRAELLSALNKLLKRQDVALIVSTDYSHYLSLSDAEREDKKTVTTFCSGNAEEIMSLNNPQQSDCPLCLWLLFKTAQENGFWNPKMVWHSNSASLLGDKGVESTTSHFVFLLGESEGTSSCFQ